MRTLLLIALVACGGDDAPANPDAAVAPPDAAGGFGTACTGACQTTALSAQFMVTRTLNLAFYGRTAADNTLHVEAYLGGVTSCPTMNSPSPEYQLILGRVPVPTSAAPSTSPGNILDYSTQGDLLGGPLGQAATTVMVTPVAYQADTHVALDLDLVFPSGTVTGHLYATHCASLDE